MKTSVRRLLWRACQVLGVALLLLVGVGVTAGWTGFGARSDGPRSQRMQASPQWRDGRFVNPQPLDNNMWGALTGWMAASRHRRPVDPVATVIPDTESFAVSPPTGLRMTWFGHSSLLVEIDGHRVLTDPMWSERASPVSWLGPQRYFAPLVPLSRLPTLDAVVISHDHYDHLDQATIHAMKDWNVRFVVPLGLGAHLARWGVPEARIVELDWWQTAKVNGLTIVSTPARHASGRMLIDNDAKLWAGYALVGDKHRVFFSGDSGLFPALKDVGERLGPFDLTMIEAGQYNQAWPDWHMGPEQAVAAHQMVRGRVLLPIHWGLFTLAFHGWTEPCERALAAAQQAGVTIVVPRPGQSFEPDAPPAVERWWPALSWNTGAQDPIVSTKMR